VAFVLRKKNKMEIDEIPSMGFSGSFRTQLVKKDETYYVEVEVKDGFIKFEFSDFEFGGRLKDCECKCWLEMAGKAQDVFEQRLNIMSSGGRKDYVTQLGYAFGKKDYSWALIFSNVCSQVIEHIENSIKARSYSDFNEPKETDLLAPFLRDSNVNVYFGMGSSGKTLLALEMGLCVAFGLPFLGYKPQTIGNFMLVDYEDRHREFFNRLTLLATDRGIEPSELDKRAFRFESKDRLSLKEYRNKLRQEIRLNKIKLLIIDSAAMAAGGDLGKQEVAGNFFNTLNSLNVCILLICHQTKSEEGDKYPFGSIFFYNNPRNIWRVEKDQELDEADFHIGLIHRKCNYDKLQTPKAAHIVIKRGDSIQIKPENNSRWIKELGMKMRILDALEDSPKTMAQLVKELEVKKGPLKVRLSELKNTGKIKLENGKYSLFFPVQFE
jgi:hypothetical protein